ncbi:acyltransferase [Termitidicoccus mucosus]|uniref:Acetyltransferase n=1 Tax=Termitidicoccus mucosus TaxID=1184151 RepID=A0A178IFK2_9BACT|nr:hypothetical protein AW736_20240 [Opitutaceae bacterium TSB47]
MSFLGIIVRLGQGLASRWRNVWFRALGVRMTGYVWLREVSIPRQWGDIFLEKGTSLDDGVVLLCSGPSSTGKIYIRGAYLNRYTMLDAHEKIEIGEGCMIGPHCYITDADHGTNRDIPVSKQPMRCEPVILERGVWLGAGVRVLKGVTIGEGAAVGAGAVVTKDVEAWSIVAGVPARVIGHRKG